MIFYITVCGDPRRRWLLTLLLLCAALPGPATHGAGSLLSWGLNNAGQTNVPAGLTNVVAVAAGQNHSLALRDDGTVVAWGSNATGQTNLPPGLDGVSAMASGLFHNLAVRADGTVVAWGQNIYGQTNVPAGLQNVVAVAAGTRHSLALRADGTVAGWGTNEDGQITIPPNLTNALAIAAGAYHSLALRRDGTVVAWGRTNYLQTAVPASATNILALAAGGDHSLALRADGQVIAWGYSVSGLTNVPVDLTNAVGVAAGYYFNSALRADGRVVAWGANNSGQTNVPPGMTNVVALAAGYGHALALRDSDFVVSSAPRILTQPHARTIYSGTTVTLDVLAIAPDPIAYQWQFGETNLAGATNASLVLENVQFAQAGLYRVVVSSSGGVAVSIDSLLSVVGAGPIIVSGPSNVVTLAGSTAEFHVTADGSEPFSYQWQFNGADISGATSSSLFLSNIQLADQGGYRCVVSNAFGVITSSAAILIAPALVIASQPQSQTVLALASVTFSIVAVGSGPFTYQWRRSGISLTEGGWILGAQTATLTLSNVLPADAGSYSVTVHNAFGTASSSNAWLAVVPLVAWGTNSFGQTSIPLSLTNVTAVAAGAYHNLGLKADGTVVAWGQNSSGQINVPPSLSNVEAVAAGVAWSLALRGNGTVMAWGSGIQTNAPSALSNVIAIAAGGFHGLALKQNGTVVAWGQNTEGQTNVPPGLSNVIAIAAGQSHSLALKADGRVVAWGWNTWGQTNVPPGLSNVVAIAAGMFYSLALKDNGTVAAWGSNSLPSGLSNVVAIAAGAAGAPDHGLALTDDDTLLRWGNTCCGLTNIPSGLTGIAAVAAGANHDLALVFGSLAVNPITPGAVVAWGNNNYGQTTVPVAAQSGVVAIAAGGSEYGGHTVALKTDGSVVAWGENDYGQTTVPVAAQSGVTAIAAGAGHTVALKNDGSVLAWGRNFEGQTNVPVAAQSGVTAIAAGRVYTVALKTDGSVVAWGSYYTVPGEAQSGVMAIAAGRNHTVALKNNGSVVAWGRNYEGQTTVPGEAQSGVTAIAAGANHTLALKIGGRVLGWGDDDNDQSDVPGEAQSGVVAIAAGGYHSLALKADGSVVAWGENEDPWEQHWYGQATVPVAAQSGVEAIAGGSYHSVALVIPSAPSIIAQPVSQVANAGQSATFTVTARGAHNYFQWRKDGTNLPGAVGVTLHLNNVWFSDAGYYTVVVSNSLGSVTSAPAAVLTVNATSPGAVIAWGYNGRGQTTVPVTAQSGVIAIAAGYGHTVALKNDGSVVAWAGDGYGEAIVPVAAQSAVRAIAAGRYHTVALKNDGSVVAWGSYYTVPVAAQSGVTAIAAGSYHDVALKNDGSVVAWGWNDYGQTMVPIAAQSGVIAITAGYGHTVALKDNGSVVAWGDNWYGQTTVPVVAQSGVIAIAAGYAHTVALKNDGSVVAWGYNYSGQTTVPVVAQSGVVAIAAGDWHTVALKNDGSVLAWGRNDYGQTTVPVAAQSGVIAIAGGGFHTVALLGDGRPILTSHLVNQTAFLGETVRLAAMVVGNGPMFYQWRFNGLDIAGGTNALFEILNVQTNQAGAYTFVASNALGWVTGAVAQVTVLVPAHVDPLPPSTTVLLGSNVTFSANASGTPPLIYQWRKNGANIPGATNATFTLTNVQVIDGGAYTVVVQNNYGVATSDPTLLIVEVPPQAPGDNFANRATIMNTVGVIGGTNRFATKETGEPHHGGKAGSNSVWYTWTAPATGIATFRTQGSVFDTLLGIYTGGTVSNLTTIASDEDLGGFFTSEVQFNALAGTSYHIAVDGFAGGSGEFILGWDLEITSDTLPVITNQPISRAVLIGSDVTFNVSATGTGLTYQWFFNDSALPGATNTALTRSSVQAADVGYYTVRVRNSVGREVDSLAAALELVSELRPLSQDKLEDLLSPPPAPDGRPPKEGGSSFTVSLGTIDYQIVSNVRSTTQPLEPTPCDVIGGASQWIVLRGTSNGMFRIDTLGSSINTVLTVYRYTNLLYLHTAQVACDDNGAPDGVRSLLWFNATANTDYLVVVDGVNYERGTIHINWAFGLPPSAGTNSLAPQHTFLRGESLTLRSPATNGLPPPRFQWLWNGSPLAGATNASLTLTNLQPAQVGFYTVVVSNALGTLTYATDLGVEVPTFQAELTRTNKTLRLWLPTVTNQTTVVETSTNLLNWTPVYFYAPPQNNYFDLSITNAAQQFFRTRSITSPPY